MLLVVLELQMTDQTRCVEVSVSKLGAVSGRL